MDGELKLKHFYESQQLSLPLIYQLFQRANFFKELRKAVNKENNKPLKDKILATLFYEPSTRTRFSFESAMKRLGGSVISTENAKEFSSAVKGESIEDTIRVVSKYVDCIVIRHYEEGAAKKAAEVSFVPIINAGDGRGQHPTQSLLDIYTIYNELGRLENLQIAIVGDLTNGRTVRSLCYLLAKFNNNKIIFISPDNLKMGNDIKHYLQMHDTKFSEESDLRKVLPEIDIIYMTRLQKERMTPEDYEMAKGKFILNLNDLILLKKEARVLHPLPKVDEIQLPIEVEEEDKRIAYFRQAENGLYIRMALLEHLLGA